ncbi:MULTISPECIES: hypothetical protein [Nitrincola]|nr:MULTISPECIES: hypothetical protein [Nitrincola]
MLYSQTFAIKLAEGNYHIQVIKPIDDNYEFRGEQAGVSVYDFTEPVLA